MISQEHELLASQQKEREIKSTRAFCYIDPQLSKGNSLKLGDLLGKGFDLQISYLDGRLNQRTFLNKNLLFNASDIFIFFLRVAHVEEINELYGKWRDIKKKNAKAFFIIFDHARFSFSGEDNDPSISRFLTMKADSNTRILLAQNNHFNTTTFVYDLKQLLSL